MAHITFLGTGGDAYTVGRALRGAGGIVVQMGSDQFHIDPGPGALKAAREAGIDIRHTVAILVSHAHLNHAGDLNAVASAISYGGLDRHGVILAADSVLNGAEGISPMLSEFHANCVERAITLDSVPRVGINETEIVITPASHDDPTAVGFKIVQGKQKISYTGDTGLTDELVEAHKGSTVLIANMPLDDDMHSDHQLNPSDVIALAKGVQPKLLIVTHFGQQLLKSDVRAVGRRIAKGVDCQVIVAEDGQQIDTSTYR